jgi:hypothetical protein
MKRPTPMISEPFYDVGSFMRSVIVGNGMDDLSGGDSAFRGVEKLDEFLVGTFWHAAPDHGSIEDIEGGKERRRADTLVIMGHGPTLSGFERQARLGAIERLDLALLVDGDDDGMSGWVHIETDHVLDRLTLKENDQRLLHMFERATTVAGDGEQTLAILSCEDDVDGLGHAARLAHTAKIVNPMSASMHQMPTSCFAFHHRN